MKKLAAIATAAILTASCSTPIPVPPGNPGAKLPSQVLNLHGWTLTTSLPDKTTGALEIYPKPLQDYVTEFFYLNDAKNAVVFKTPSDGAVQLNAECPRNELREVKASGATAAWSTRDGTHKLEAKLAIDAVPDSEMIVVGQVHALGPYVLIIQYTRGVLYVKAGDKNIATLDDDYKLGTVFDYRIEATDGLISVFYNGELAATYPSECTQCFFKAGSYLQVPPIPGDKSYGQVSIYELKVT